MAELVPEMGITTASEADHPLNEQDQQQSEMDVTDKAEEHQPEEQGEMDATNGSSKDKKKKKKGIDIEDMYSFDPADLQKAQPTKKKKQKPLQEQAGQQQVTQKHISKTLKAMKKFFGEERDESKKEDEATQEKEESKKEDKVKQEVKESPGLHRFPSPSRSRQSSSSTTVETEEQKVESKASGSDMDDSAKWTDNLNFGNIFFGKVKNSLTSQFCCMGRLAPSYGAQPSAANIGKDPCTGKVHEKVKTIEEADNEAEKQREAAMKAVNAEVSAQRKEAQMEMDGTLRDCFLQAVTTRIKDRDLPVMGTTLYGKMRQSRKLGTSCDVKDSSFVWLRPFLEHLEEEGLITLKPEVQDPTVTKINRSHKLIRNWKPWAWSETVGSYKTGGRR
eukprot:gnl/MRDRNA2_/MRDRNA2_89231_c0_seq1.p1 gnl/MRDRNA2_/MRDRNA2_89231_c0~~gnl/MRDRNA2_/MRDRNA2_89231_c0_seq1.p1  ORF type:complete len:430 (-),score=131.53 gnl/MRDRNA2_/MRDRNA2_89231_c0_seq1:108-1277(-)